MKAKLKDEPYMVLPYGQVAIPMSLATDVLKHCVYVDRNYSTEMHDYVYSLPKGGEKNEIDTHVVDVDTLKAALVAAKLEAS